MPELTKLALLSAVLFGSSVADSTTVKFTTQASLAFASKGTTLSEDHEAWLAELVRATKAQCAADIPDLVVTVQAAINSKASVDERAIALARAQHARQALLALGVPASSAYGGLATLEDLSARRDAGAAIDPSPNVVVLEFVCNPR